MKRFIIFLLICVSTLSTLTASAAIADWKLHPTSDSNFFKIVDTPERVYMLGYTQIYNKGLSGFSKPYFNIFYFDKKGNEFVTLSALNKLSETIGAYAEYNARKRYLLVVYDNFNIDLIYDNGKVVNIPGLMTSTVAGDKTVNDITFSPETNRAYIATNFGFIEINDDKGEIATSRVYSKPINSVARLGNDIILLIDGDVLRNSYSAANFNLDEFQTVYSEPTAKRFLPLSQNLVGLYRYNKGAYNVTLLSNNGNSLETKEIEETGTGPDVVENRDGFLIGHNAAAIQIKRDGSSFQINREKNDYYGRVGSWDMNEFWFVNDRSGLYSRKLDSSNKYVTTRNPMHPNAANAFICREFAYHPKVGMLSVNHGYSYDFTSYSASMPLLLSGLRNGLWTSYGLPYTNPDQKDIIKNPNGLAIDPENNKYIYFGSLLNGIVRINIDDPSDVLHLSRTGDPTKNLPGYVEVVPDMTAWSAQCSFSAPQFDESGNMWVAFHNNNNGSNVEVWVWSSANRKASTSASTFRPFEKIVINGYKGSNRQLLLPLQTPTNKNIVVFSADEYDGPILLIDHKGTISDTSDDEVVAMTSIYDQDGGVVDKNHIKHFYEDPATGMVWVATNSGVFYFEPRQTMRNPSSVTRPKVSRNDGSGYADYLLNGVDVMRIASDGNGRKWFATLGAGLVCTSSDGRTIMGEYTVDNSPLPDDRVVSVAYNPESSSMLISTMLGMAEYHIAGSTSDTASDRARAYPNPVRPDYFGWVTIDGLPDNAVVKITDASGNIVKELGLAENGTVQWDATNIHHKRVATGVYYVLASSGPGDQSLARVTKVLIMN